MNKKAFLIIITLLYLCPIHAQQVTLSGVKEVLNTMFSGLDKTKVSTGYLWDTSVNLIKAEYYNGSALTDSNFVTLPLLGDMLTSINSASVGADTICVQASLSRIERNSSMHNSMVGILFQPYNYIVANALTDNLISYSNGVVSDVYNNGVWQNPYGETVLFGFATGNDGVVGQSATFTIANIDSLSTQMFQSIEFDPGDGNGFRSISMGGTIPVSYNSTGHFETILKVTVGGQMYQSHSLVTVKSIISPFNGHVVNSPADTVSANYNGSTYSASITLGSTVDFHKRPLIVSEGFDPWRLSGHSNDAAGFTTISDIITALDTINYTLLFDNYDVYYVDWYDCGADIRANAEVLKAVIRWVNENNLSGEPNIVLGQSMGGLIARYALRDMELKNELHNTTLFVSHDVPYLGANVSPGLLYTYWDIHNIVSTFSAVSSFFPKNRDRMYELLRLGTYTSVQQMLPLYMNTSWQYDSTYYNELQNELRCMGFPKGDPSKEMDNVAIVNGGRSSLGSLSLYNPGDTLIDFDLEITSGIIPELILFVFSLDKGNMPLIPGKTTLSFQHTVYPFVDNTSKIRETELVFKKKFLWLLPTTFNLFSKTHYAPSTGTPLDSVTGSYYDVSNLMDRDSIYYHSHSLSHLDSLWLGHYSTKLTWADKLSFIPTASAMSMPTGFSRDFYASPPTAGVDIPFSSYILQNHASEHIDFFPGIADWLSEVSSISFDIDPVVFDNDTLSVTGGSGSKTYSFSSSNPSAATVNGSTGVISVGGGGLTTFKASWTGFGQAISKSRDVIIGYPSVTLGSHMLPDGQCMVRANGCTDTERRLIKAAVDSSIIRYKWGVKINHNPVSWRTASTQDTIHVSKPSTGSVTVYMKWERSNGESGGVVSHSLMRGGLFSCNIGDIYEDRGHVITYTECLPGFPEVTQEYGHQCFVFSESTNHDPSGEIVSITIGDNTFDLTGTMIANSGELLYVFDILYDSDFLDELYYTHTNGLFGYRLIDIYINDSSGPFQEVNIFYRKELNTGGPILDN